MPIHLYSLGTGTRKLRDGDCLMLTDLSGNLIEYDDALGYLVRCFGHGEHCCPTYADLSSYLTRMGVDPAGPWEEC